MKTFPPRFASYEDFRAYRNEVNAKYHASEKGLAARRRDNASPLAKERYARYRRTTKYVASQRRRAESAKGKQYAAEYLKAKRLRAPAKFQARHAVASAIRRGFVRPTACQRCCAAKRLHAHHHRGYAPEHWLDVEWLCPKCHKAAHMP